MRLSFFVMLFATVSVFSVVTSSAHAAEITVDISRAVYPGYFDKYDKPFEAETGIKITYVEDPKLAADMSVILQNVISGKAEVGIGPIAMKDWLILMEKEKKPVAKPDELASRVISKDLIAFVVDPRCEVKTLKLEQLKLLYTGKIKNWKELGGKDMPIVALLPKVAHTKAFVKSQLLRGEEFTTGKETESAPETMKAVATTPGAIGWAPMNQITGDNKKYLLQTEDFGRPVTLVTKGKPSDNVFKLIKYLGDHKP